MPSGTEWPSRYEEVTAIAREIALVAGDTASVILATRPDAHGNLRPLPALLTTPDPGSPPCSPAADRASVERRVHQLERELKALMSDLVRIGTLLLYADGSGDRLVGWRPTEKRSPHPYQVELITNRFGTTSPKRLIETVEEGTRFFWPVE